MVVKALLQRLRGSRRPDPVHVLEAARAGHAARVRELLARGGGACVADERGMTPLMYAASAGELDMTRALLAAGADLEARRSDGGTALILAAAHGRAEILGELLAQGANLEARDVRGRSALAYAAMHGKLEAVRALLDAEASPKTCGPDGLTPFLDAVVNGRLEVAAAFLERGIDVESRAGDRTALMLAAEFGRAAMVMLLLASGADPNARTRDGHTALSLTLARRNLGLAEGLIGAGADPNTRMGHGSPWPGWPVLVVAASEGWLSLAGRLLDRGAAVDETEPGRGRTALFQAVVGRRLPMVRLLLERGADRERADSAGTTPAGLVRRWAESDASILGLLPQAVPAGPKVTGPSGNSTRA